MKDLNIDLRGKEYHNKSCLEKLEYVKGAINNLFEFKEGKLITVVYNGERKTIPYKMQGIFEDLCAREKALNKKVTNMPVLDEVIEKSVEIDVIPDGVIEDSTENFDNEAAHELFVMTREYKEQEEYLKELRIAIKELRERIINYNALDENKLPSNLKVELSEYIEERRAVKEEMVQSRKRMFELANVDEPDFQGFKDIVLEKSNIFPFTDRVKEISLAIINNGIVLSEEEEEVLDDINDYLSLNNTIRDLNLIIKDERKKGTIDLADYSNERDLINREMNVLNSKITKYFDRIRDSKDQETVTSNVEDKVKELYIKITGDSKNFEALSPELIAKVNEFILKQEDYNNLCSIIREYKLEVRKGKRQKDDEEITALEKEASIKRKPMEKLYQEIYREFLNISKRSQTNAIPTIVGVQSNTEETGLTVVPQPTIEPVNIVVAEQKPIDVNNSNIFSDNSDQATKTAATSATAIDDATSNPEETGLTVTSQPCTAPSEKHKKGILPWVLSLPIAKKIIDRKNRKEYKTRKKRLSLKEKINNRIDNIKNYFVNNKRKIISTLGGIGLTAGILVILFGTKSCSSKNKGANIDNNFISAPVDPIDVDNSVDDNVIEIERHTCTPASEIEDEKVSSNKVTLTTPIGESKGTKQDNIVKDNEYSYSFEENATISSSSSYYNYNFDDTITINSDAGIYYRYSDAINNTNELTPLFDGSYERSIDAIVFDLDGETEIVYRTEANAYEKVQELLDKGATEEAILATRSDLRGNGQYEGWRDIDDTNKVDDTNKALLKTRK